VTDRHPDPPSAGPPSSRSDPGRGPATIVPGEPAAAPGRLGARLLAAGLRLSLVASPRPTALLVRRLFAQGAADRARRQLEAAPPDVAAILDERYGAGGDERMDVYLPAAAQAEDRQLPCVVWTHGGAFVGGSKEELGGYLRVLAARGFVVVGIRYSLAPEAHYPEPTRQLMAALGHVAAQAARLHVDPARIVLAGDSAGAQISAQAAAIITGPAYAATMGIRPAVEPRALRGVVLCCGIYDITALNDRGPSGSVLRAVAWAYSGERDYRHATRFTTTMSVANHLTEQFPQAFVTAGNADPLLPQSEALIERLKGLGVGVDHLLYARGHVPALGHEYQFDLDLQDGRVAFARIVAFIERVTGRPRD
jgi:acetyl esterase